MILIVYLIGVVIAFILGCIEAYYNNKLHNDIDDFPAMIVPLSVMSWIYIFYVIKDRRITSIKNKLKN